MKNPIFFILFIIFLILNIIDSYTASYILDGESNPVFLLTDSIYCVYFFKIFILIVIFLIYRYNKFKTEFQYYLIVLILTISILTMSFAIYSNILGINNPAIVEEARGLTSAQKVSGYSNFIFLTNLLPIFFSVLSFKLFQKSKKYVVIENG